MAVSFDILQNALKEGWGRKTVTRAIAHQNRLKFHAQTELTANLSQPFADFMAFVSNILPHDKLKLFKTLFRYPLKTNEVTAKCFDKLSRIFDGRNPVFNYQFKSSETLDDWQWYRHAKLKEPEIWQTLGWDFYKTEPNSVLIVDLPKEQTTEQPEPYFYWLSISDVAAYGKSGKDFDFIIIKSDGGATFTVIDADTYSVYVNDRESLGELISQSAHNLGYVPAMFFVTEPISISEPDVKASPLTKELDALDWYLFFTLSKRHLDLYASYPIYSGYEQACDFINAENGDYCDGGFLKDKQGFYKFDANGLMCRCPKCGDKRIVGVGSFVEIPIPTERQPDLRNPVQMLTVDKDSLDYNVSEIGRLEREIINAVCGYTEDAQTKTAINEQQVMASFQSQINALNNVKKQFEKAQTFVDATVCRLRYGDAFVSASVNYGTEFFIFDAATLRERYKTAKDSGASESELDALQQQILETEFRHNPAELQRMMILHELEPYRHLTAKEVTDLHTAGVVSDEDLKLKLNFTNLIKRFERENLNIVEFGTALNYADKIKRIKETLTTYIH